MRSTLVTFTNTLWEGERHFSPWMEGARFKETLLNKIIIPRSTLNYQFELVTLGSETPTGRTLNLVAVCDIPGQIRLNALDTLCMIKRVPLNFNVRNNILRIKTRNAEDVKLPMLGFQNPRMAVC